VAFVGEPRFVADAVAAVRQLEDVEVARVDGCSVIGPLQLSGPVSRQPREAGALELGHRR